MVNSFQYKDSNDNIYAIWLKVCESNEYLKKELKNKKLDVNA